MNRLVQPFAAGVLCCSVAFQVSQLSSTAAWTYLMLFRQVILERCLEIIQLCTLGVLYTAHAFMGIGFSSVETSVATILIFFLRLHGGNLSLGRGIISEVAAATYPRMRRRTSPKCNSHTPLSDDSPRQKSSRRIGFRKTVRSCIKHSTTALSRTRKLLLGKRVQYPTINTQPVHSVNSHQSTTSTTAQDAQHPQTSSSSPGSSSSSSSSSMMMPTSFSYANLTGFASISSVFDRLSSLPSPTSSLPSLSDLPSAEDEKTPAGMNSERMFRRSMSEPSIPISAAVVHPGPPLAHSRQWTNALSPECLSNIQEELSQAPSPNVKPTGEWEEVLVKEMPNVTYTVWKKPWKNGLSYYKSSTVIRGVNAQDMYTFQSDNTHRCKWDANCEEFKLLDTNPENCHAQLEYWRSKFPRPMASREYVFAKQDWCDESGAFLSLSKGVGQDNWDLDSSGRRKRVTEYLVGTKVEDLTNPGDRLPTSQLVQICCEDNFVSPSLVNMSLKRGLVGFVETRQAALEKYIEAGLPSRSGIKLPPGLGVESPIEWTSMDLSTPSNTIKMVEIKPHMQRASQEYVRKSLEVQRQMGIKKEQSGFSPLKYWVGNLFPKPWLQRLLQKNGEQKRPRKRDLLRQEVEKAVQTITEKQVKMKTAVMQRVTMSTIWRPRRLLQVITRRSSVGSMRDREQIGDARRRKPEWRRKVRLIFVALPLLNGLKTSPSNRTVA